MPLETLAAMADEMRVIGEVLPEVPVEARAVASSSSSPKVSDGGEGEGGSGGEGGVVGEGGEGGGEGGTGGERRAHEPSSRVASRL